MTNDNIVLYGISDEVASALARRYGFELHRGFDRIEPRRCLIVQPVLSDDDGRRLFYEHMQLCGDRIAAVIAVDGDDLASVYYSSPTDRFFSVSGERGDEALYYELGRIIESRLSMICAHECI